MYAPVPLSPTGRLRAALAYAGTPSALSHRTGLAVWGLLPLDPALVHVTVPHERRVRSLDFVLVHRSRRWAGDGVLVRRSLPVLRLERCLVGACAAPVPRDEVRDLVALAVQSGRTTPARVAAEPGAAPSCERC